MTYCAIIYTQPHHYPPDPLRIGAHPDLVRQETANTPGLAPESIARSCAVAQSMMESSQTLMSAQIQFLDTQLALIHIPLRLYPSFLQPILRLLLPTDAVDERPKSRGSGSSLHTNEHPFINISVTPIECSIALPRQIAETLFIPARDGLCPSDRDSVTITKDDYVVMQVDGEGLEAGQRVLELTSPLAMAGISIFFITTYFSDYILVPLRARSQVISALENRGFAFEPHKSSSTSASYSHRQTSSSHDISLPGTPPPTTITELQTRTFATLKRHHIVPTVDESIKLVQCAGRIDDSTPINDRLSLGLVQCLAVGPKFLSLTLTDTEPPSLLLEQRMLPFFEQTSGIGSQSVLLGSKEDILIPIILDLRTLPLESTGIVCGVAGRLVGGTKLGLDNAVEMSYLSTAKSGTVTVAEAELERALSALRNDCSENGVVQPN
ncbi:uncharacterized protein PV09_02163 [Verruconis gallopava]|uniref:CASTOR ACT domain-containing protein n=1 Tax=Verruconis gallopava TaxID=253628 RepID=A0A0D2AKD0_9PEZI|nr:uncharacterized protein PV09_02163 [Verruconis gallopava]KIW07313.1 hypothetical protein PV09_02163 [Verruconis gallopava]